MTACTTGDPRGGGCTWPSAASSWTERRGRAPAARRRAWAWASPNPRPSRRTRRAASAASEPCWPRALPTIARLGSYGPGMLRDDVVAGLALSALLVPVGMGYAEAAGLPAIAGLYATIGALVAYFLVGPSRILVFGPDSALLPLVAAAVVPLCRGRPGALDGPRRRARDHGRAHVPGRGDRPPGLRHRPALAADPDRLHERDRPHDPRGPAAEAPGLLGGRQRRRRGRGRARPGHRHRGDRAARPRHRPRQPGGHPRAAAGRAPDPRASWWPSSAPGSSSTSSAWAPS